MGAGHDHALPGAGHEKRLLGALLLTTGFLIAEVIGGILSGTGNRPGCGSDWQTTCRRAEDLRILPLRDPCSDL